MLYKCRKSEKTFDLCREYAKKCGFDGMIFAVYNTSLEKDACDNVINRGYDFRFGYTSGYQAPRDFYSDEDDIVNQQCNLFTKRLETDCRNFIPTASCFWDPTPRYTKRWCDLGYNFNQTKRWYISPEKFKVLLRKMKEISDSLPEDAWARKIIMIDNWNEWDEGHFVAPSIKFGYKYLQAIRESLTECDNLPDYITPHDQGFIGYNKSWKTPDFSDFCKRKLKDNKKGNIK